MAALEYVIGVNARDAADLANSLNLPRRSVVTSTEAIGGRRPARVHLTDGFWKRRDLPAVAAALRSMLYSSPKTQILGYSEMGDHIQDFRLTPRATWVPLEANSTIPAPRQQAKPEKAPEPEPVEDDDELIRPGEEEQPLPVEPEKAPEPEPEPAADDDDPFGTF